MAKILEALMPAGALIFVLAWYWNAIPYSHMLQGLVALLAIGLAVEIILAARKFALVTQKGRRRA